MQRELVFATPLPWHAFNADGSGAYMFHPQHYALIDPFIGVDVFTMSQRVFAPHPHGGMSAVTWHLPESGGAILNRDSLGDESIIAPGDIHWTQAGGGIIHEETPLNAGEETRGLQVFVNLALAHKHSHAAVFKSEAASQPRFTIGAAAARLYAGSFMGLQAALAKQSDWHTQVVFLELTSPPNETIELPVSNGQTAFAILMQGGLAGIAHTTSDTPRFGIIWQREGTEIKLTSGEQGARLLFCLGTPLREPIARRGPFTGASELDNRRYSEAYQSGAMGELQARS